MVAARNYPLPIFFIAAALDQGVKLLFRDQVILNPGVSFSLGADLPPSWVALGVSGIALALALVSWTKVGDKPAERICHALFFAGSFSNLLDRWLLGGVRDIWTVPVIGVRNNLADWLILGAAFFWAGWHLAENYLKKAAPSGDTIRP